MLDKEKCKYLIKTAQFLELQKLLEKEYEEMFDKSLKSKFPKDKLTSMSMTVKVKQIMLLKPQTRSAMLRFSNIYFSEETKTPDKLKTLLDLYKPLGELLNR